jgi:hypothetical protein
MPDALVRKVAAPGPSVAGKFGCANYLHWYIGRHFHAIRLANAGRFPQHRPVR